MTMGNILNIFNRQPAEERSSYIDQCKQNYFLGIYPADRNAREKAGYKTLVEIARSYFNKNLYEDFALYFMEGQYFIQLWTAHLILEYGQPNEDLKKRCIDEITSYSTSSHSPNVAKQEQEWLRIYGNNNP